MARRVLLAAALAVATVALDLQLAPASAVDQRPGGPGGGGPIAAKPPPEPHGDAILNGGFGAGTTNVNEPRYPGDPNPLVKGLPNHWDIEEAAAQGQAQAPASPRERQRPRRAQGEEEGQARREERA